VPILAASRAFVAKFWKVLTPALILSLAIPVWQVYWVQRPDVHVEVTQVERKALDDARKIVLRNDDALKFLTSDNYDRLTGNRTRDIDEVAKLIDDYDRDLKDGQKRLQEKQKQLETLRPETLTWQLTNDTLNEEFKPNDVNKQDFDKKYQEPIARAELTARVRDKLQDTIKEEVEQFNKATDNLQKGRARLQVLYEALDRNEARIRAGCAVTNSGQGAMSLRREAVLRVFLGSNNYIDVELVMDDYASNADLQPKHSRVVTFSSAPIRTLDSAAQDRIRAYWGQNVRSKLFVTDIEGRVYHSPTFPFAQGLYQQLIYDRLKKIAARDPLTSQGAD